MSIFAFVAANLIYSVIAFGGLLMISSVVNAVLFWQIVTMRRRLKIFFQSRQAQDLESVIAQQIKRQIKSEKDIQELFKSSRESWRLITKCVQKVGVVRFNPFKDTGSDQSFAIALMDLSDNGLVISSLFTREGTRIYSKPLEKGKSKYPLSEEEQRAIGQAQEQK
ncbi:MAG: DUF4446 family protein [Candidatus Portnoybacteria bacterium]|nr:DUF4446 family protein [Candidatus Portnoybacteria bacterium]